MIHYPRPGEDYFVPFEVILIAPFKRAGFKVGDKVKAEKVPNGNIYLFDNDNRVFMTEALEDIHFRQKGSGE